MGSKTGKGRGAPRYDTIYNERTGSYDIYFRPAPEQLTWPARLWFRFFDWLERLVDDYLTNYHPTSVMLRQEAEEAYEKFRRHGDYLREKYPERYAEAVAELRSERPY